MHTGGTHNSREILSGCWVNGLLENNLEGDISARASRETPSESEAVSEGVKGNLHHLRGRLAAGGSFRDEDDLNMIAATNSSSITNN